MTDFLVSREGAHTLAVGGHRRLVGLHVLPKPLAQRGDVMHDDGKHWQA